MSPSGSPDLKLKDLKISEGDEPGISIIFDKEDGLYLGRREKTGGDLFPLLKDEKLLAAMPVVTVDAGAIKFVCNGANIMRPGITKIEGDFSKSSLVLIREQKFGKAIAVGRALGSSDELRAMQKGVAVENLHYVGDTLWNQLKEMGATQ